VTIAAPAEANAEARSSALPALLGGILIMLPIIVAAALIGHHSSQPLRAILVVPTGYSVHVSPETVAVGDYTVQLHNLASVPMRVTIASNGRALAPPVEVPAFGWEFPTISVPRDGIYTIEAAAQGAKQQGAFAAR
jgi:hypothetical protein